MQSRRCVRKQAKKKSPPTDELIVATPEITAHLKVVQESYKLDKKGVNLQNVTVFAPLETENLDDFVSLRDRKTQEPITLTDEGKKRHLGKIGEFGWRRTGDKHRNPQR